MHQMRPAEAPEIAVAGLALSHPSYVRGSRRMAALKRPQGCSEAPSSIVVFFSNDVMLTLHLTAVTTNGGKR